MVPGVGMLAASALYLKNRQKASFLAGISSVQMYKSGCTHKVIL
jgi:hypothetical protein